MVAKRAKHVAPNNVAICCVQMLRSFGRGLKMVKYSCNICGCCVMLFSFGSCHNLALGNSSICKTQHVVTGWPTCCAQQCCDMLRWNVTIVWPVLYTPLFPVKILHACSNALNASYVIKNINFSLCWRWTDATENLVNKKPKDRIY